MEKLGLNTIRSMFRDFYVSKDHYPGKSSSLIPPANDKSLLIINSGMAPLKAYFSGAETPPKNRMTTCQKCIRTGDIENVGITARHGTFFEMLGNFSFGDYFKTESLHWGWEFITEWLKMPADKMWATVYEDDDEAVEIWKEIGMPEERIVRLGKDDNFWEIGLGPCGPCSEIYFDRGPEYGCDNPDCKPGCDCDRYMEFWNHVFTQFSREEDGSYSDLEHPNIDTGMGLERMACIMQGVDSIYDIDTVRHILNGVLELTDKKYEQGDNAADISIRIITDHLRSMVFMIADGILPSNEGRGYVLRRLIRRAARHGRLLGIDGTFLAGLVQRVVDVSGEAYPEIVEKYDYITQIISVEEKRFSETLEHGSQIINGYIDEMNANGEKVLSGEKTFKLYDTYGFPVELTEEILNEEGLSADLEGFNACMEKQRKLAQEGQKNTDEAAWKDDAIPNDLNATVFTGYDRTEDEAAVLRIYKDGEPVDSVTAGETAVIYLDQTPFYAESGGQVSDHGEISADEFHAAVTDMKKQNDLSAHVIQVDQGELTTGAQVHCAVDRIKRNSTARNHTATHLLQQALREVVGTHVEQAGSKNDEDMLRFDFTHFEPLTKEQISRIEDIVNQKITEFIPVVTKEMSIDEARETGAMALFGEKYGDIVRVVSIDDWSIELCGGTHVSNTGQIGVFIIESESGIASGVRRIEAITGTELLVRARENNALISSVSEILKASADNLETKAASVISDLKNTKKELDSLKKEELGSDLDSIINNAREIGGVRLITGKFDNCTIDDLRSMSDRIKEKGISAVTVLAAVNDGKVVLMTSVTDDLTDKGYHAGKLIKNLAKEIGGGGGGKADMAQAGGSNAAGIENAFKRAEELISE